MEEFRILIVQGLQILVAHVKLEKQPRFSLAVHLDDKRYYNELEKPEPVDQVKTKVKRFTESDATEFLKRAEAHFKEPKRKRLQT
ncbi:hypothetical protein GCM10028805_52310 [Spirosoma harenae]